MLIIGKGRCRFGNQLWVPPFFLQSCKCYSCRHRGLSFFHAALHQNKGLSCSSWWLGSMLCLWEWEARGLRGTEKLMSSLFEKGKKFQNVLRCHRRDLEALPSLGRCSSSRWKNYNPCLPSSSPSPKVPWPSKPTAELRCTYSLTG